jgi:hypothetical protein
MAAGGVSTCLTSKGSSGVELPNFEHKSARTDTSTRRTCFMRLSAEPALNHSICCSLKVCLRGTLTWEPSALFKTLHHNINNSM